MESIIEIMIKRVKIDFHFENYFNIISVFFLNLHQCKCIVANLLRTGLRSKSLTLIPAWMLEVPYMDGCQKGEKKCT